jgi:hypothetical protein
MGSHLIGKQIAAKSRRKKKKLLKNYREEVKAVEGGITIESF